MKQVIVIRKDLSMRRGKEIAQGSHASMEFLVGRLRAQLAAGATGALSVSLTDAEREWIAHGTGKICLKIEGEAELVALHDKARAAGLEAHLIRDAGRTEFHGVPTLTALAIGPGPAAAIDAVTGHLVLY